jgi:hypothetical protein
MAAHFPNLDRERAKTQAGWDSSRLACCLACKRHRLPPPHQAHAALVRLYPEQQSMVAAAYDASLALIPDGPDKTNGLIDSDLIVRAGLACFYRVWLGQMEYGAALRCGEVVVDGPASLARQLPRWFLWSPMARFVREGESTRRGHRTHSNHQNDVRSNSSSAARPRSLSSGPGR